MTELKVAKHGSMMSLPWVHQTIKFSWTDRWLTSLSILTPYTVIKDSILLGLGAEDVIWSLGYAVTSAIAENGKFCT